MNNDKRELVGFLDNVSEVLSTAMDCRAVLFRQERRKEIEKTWPEIKEEIQFLKTDLEEHYQEYRKYLKHSSLTGQQLNFKLSGFAATYEQFKIRGSIKWLKKLFKRINIILKSLVAAMPGASSLTEFKDMVEQDIEDMEDDA
jgi:hypothetical protein